MPDTIEHHDFRDGESFEYYYEDSEATYATDAAHEGSFPRVTELQKLEEVRTRIRISIFAGERGLAKRVELEGLSYRERTADDVRTGRVVEFEPLVDLVPGFPATFTHEYPVNGDAGVAQGLHEVFAGFSHPALSKLVDIFTWPTVVDTVPDGFAVGQIEVGPAVDVDLMGGSFHNHERIVLFDRIDRVDEKPQAYLKLQSPGNYFTTFGVETNYQLSCHVFLDGPAVGLVSRGELQEMVYIGMQGGGPVTAIQRQVSMTMQGDQLRSDASP